MGIIIAGSVIRRSFTGRELPHIIHLGTVPLEKIDLEEDETDILMLTHERGSK